MKRRDRSNLIANDFVYRRLLEHVTALEGEGYGDRLDLTIALAAAIAWRHHTGRFSDGALENPLLRVGRDLRVAPLEVADTPWDAHGLPVTLHVMTQLYLVAGHARLLARWVEGDRSAHHVVVLTRHKDPIPSPFTDAIDRGFGTLVVLPPQSSTLARAATLRRLAARCDRVVLHHDPNDPTPSIAFAIAGGPPVALFNHAHFSFSLGFGVADLVISATEYYRRMSESFRFARRTERLIYFSTFTRPSDEPVDKEAAKAALGLAAADRVVLSVGHQHYFQPNAEYDFFRAIRRVLAADPKVVVLMMGVYPDGDLVPADLRAEPRLRLLGAIADPMPYYRAGDVFLESFPMPSLGAVGEAVAHGEAFPIPVFGKTEGVLRITQEPMFKYRYRPTDEADYVRHVLEVLERLPEARSEARRMRESILRVDREWPDQLVRLNRTIDALEHLPQELPTTAMIASEDTRTLAAWNPLDVARTLNFLPWGSAVRAQVAAVLEGHTGAAEAARRLGRRARAGVRARLGAISVDFSGARAS